MGQLDDLVALREQLQQWLLEADVDKRSPLVGQYLATIERIDKLTPKEAVGDGIDQIAARRSARRAGTAAHQGRAERQG